MNLLDLFRKQEPVLMTLELKKLFDAERVGIKGVPQAPAVDIAALQKRQRTNELVYACIRKKCQAICDPDVIVEKKNKKGEWETWEGHPLPALLNRPNDDDTRGTFFTAWQSSEEITGDFYAEIVRNKLGFPVALYPLNPAFMQPIPDNKGRIVKYQYNDWTVGTAFIDIDARDILHSKKPDLQSRFYGLSPLQVAIGSVDADQSQTDFVRSFFHSDGIPSGLLKVLNRTLSKEEANATQQGWMAKYRRGGSNYKQVAVLDQNAEYQKIGTDLSEIESDSTREQSETRICMVFGVPPILVGAFVGLKNARQNATTKTILKDFWDNEMSPTLRDKRDFLTWNLLTEYHEEVLIRTGQIRVNWDVSQVMALQEDEDKRHDRARKNLSAGGWTVNEFREATGQEPIDGADYFLQPKSIEALSEEMRQTLSEQEPVKVPAQLGAGDPNAEDPNAGKGGVPDIVGFRALDRILDDAISNSGGSIKKKSYDLDGLTLSREPNEVEKLLDLKGMAAAFESHKAALSKSVLALRSDLIKQAEDAIDTVGEKEIYSLTLSPPAQAYTNIRKKIDACFVEGQRQVALDLQAQGGAKGFDFTGETKAASEDETLARLVELLISRIVNEIQTRAVNIFTSLGLLGLTRDEIKARLRGDLEDQSTKAFEDAAMQAVNVSLNAGRDAEGEARSDEWETVEYSAILDQNTCGPCEDADGQQGASVDDIPPAPNPDCEGGARCRCFHIFIFKESN